MKCADVKSAVETLQSDSLPDGLKTHIDSCAECAAHWEQVRKLRGLMGLKRHEQPDPEFEQRNLAAIREQITHLSTQRQVLFLTPAFSYALAAILLALICGFIGMRVLTGSSGDDSTLPAGIQMATDVPATDKTGSEAALASAEPGGTNTQSQMQYGTQPSKVVDYEY